MNHSAKLFDWDNRSKVVIADISNLGPIPFQFINELTQCGLTVVSPNTGSGSTWVRTSIQTDDEGDIEAWHLVPTEETVERIPSLKGYEMIVFND